MKKLLLGVSLAISLVTACTITSVSGPDAGALDGGAGTDAGATTTTTDGATSADGAKPTGDGAADGSTGTDGSVKAGECGDKPTKQTCTECCTNAYLDGAAAFIGATIDCFCVPARCQAECATTLCDPVTPKDPDAKCNTCLSGKNAECTAAVSAACGADPDCVKFNKCMNESTCLTKP